MLGSSAGRANVVQVYDVDSGLEIVSLGGHKDLIQSVRFSPDRHAAGSGELPDRHALARPDGKSGEEPGGPRGSGAVNGGIARRPHGLLGRPGQNRPGLEPCRGEAAANAHRRPGP